MQLIYTPKQEYKVLVRCFTFNHCRYIEDALNGFALQQTNFPFVCLVVDDCSTDGEQDVIKAWLERECDMSRAEHTELELSNIILVPHRANERCTFAFYLLKQNLYGTSKKKSLVAPWRNCCEYEALCEGDDYWTDSLKLQRQCDVMDNNNECVMCLHQTITSKDGDVKSVLPRQELAEGWLDKNKYFRKTEIMQFQLSSYFMRISVLNEFLKCSHEFMKPTGTGDIQYLLYFLAVGEVYFLNKVMSTYRLSVENGWSHTVINNKEKRIGHYRRLSKMYSSYDDFTVGTYHEYCLYKQKKCNFLIERSNGNYKILFTKEYRECLRSEKWSVQIRMVFQYIKQILKGK